jgi:hypothetical protein
LGELVLASSQKLQKYRQIEVKARGEGFETTDKEELSTMQRIRGWPNDATTCDNGGSNTGEAIACQYLTRTGILVVIASSKCEKYDYN